MNKYICLQAYLAQKNEFKYLFAAIQSHLHILLRFILNLLNIPYLSRFKISVSRFMWKYLHKTFHRKKRSEVSLGPYANAKSNLIIFLEEDLLRMIFVTVILLIVGWDFSFFWGEDVRKG